MAAAAKLSTPEVESDPPLPDPNKPISVQWLRIPAGLFVGSVGADGFFAVGSQIADGVNISGKVEAIHLMPGGVVMVICRVGSPNGKLRFMFFTGGHGAVL